MLLFALSSQLFQLFLFAVGMDTNTWKQLGMERTITNSLVPFQPFQLGRMKLRHTLSIHTISNTRVPVQWYQVRVSIWFPKHDRGACPEFWGPVRRNCLPLCLLRRPQNTTQKHKTWTNSVRFFIFRTREAANTKNTGAKDTAACNKYELRDIKIKNNHCLASLNQAGMPGPGWKSV